MNIEALANRPTEYSNEDGIAELQIGIYLALTSAGWLLQQSRPGSDGFIWLAQAIGLCAAIAMWRGREALKSRFVYPRGGYVALEEPRAVGLLTRRGAIALVLLLGSLGFLAYSMFSAGSHGALQWHMIARAGPATIAIGYLAGGLRYGANYMLWIGAMMLVIGAIFWQASASGLPSLMKPLLLQGILLAAAGSIRLWRFIRMHPRPVDGQ